MRWISFFYPKKKHVSLRSCEKGHARQFDGMDVQRGDKGEKRKEEEERKAMKESEPIKTGDNHGGGRGGAGGGEKIVTESW